MDIMLRMILCDLRKLKGTAFYYLHVFIPLIGNMIFTFYYSISHEYSSVSKTAGFIEAVCMTYPILISILCSIVIENEQDAGNFKELIGSEFGRIKPIISKIIVLISMGFIANLFTLLLFDLCLKYILNTETFGIGFYLTQTYIMIISESVLYIIHLYINLKLSKGLSILIGSLESICSALLITNLGTGIWQFVPCSYAIRYTLNYMQKFISGKEYITSFERISTCVIGGTILIIFFVIFNNFETKSEMQ